MNSRDKGCRGEREIAHVLKEHGFKDAARGQQFHGGPDSADVVGLPGHHVEVKFTDALRLHDAMEQSIDDSGPGEVPIVAYRRTKGPLRTREWLAILSLEDYLLLVRERDALRGTLEAINQKGHGE